MKPVIIIAIIIPIVIGIIAVLIIPLMNQENLESDEARDEIIWQKLQKTYLMQECREKFIGQADEMRKCFEQIDEEQRLNPPINPQESGSETECSIQCLVYDPVCGEDGITYACGVEDAACHGIKVEYEGECLP